MTRFCKTNSFPPEDRAGGRMKAALHADREAFPPPLGDIAYTETAIFGV
jgi:hypothetical protein